MKSLKILFTLLVGMFLVSSASAVTYCYANFIGDEISQSVTITEGESINFEVSFATYDSTIDLNIYLYDSDANIIYTFENEEVPTDPNFKIYSITPKIYVAVGTYRVIVDGYATDLTLTVNAIPEDPEVPDTTIPVITLLGNNPVEIEVGDTYIDAGATATEALKILLKRVLNTGTLR